MLVCLKKKLKKIEKPKKLITFGGSELRKATVGFLEDCPAEANSRVAGSLILVRDHLRGDRPPLANTLFD